MTRAIVLAVACACVLGNPAPVSADDGIFVEESIGGTSFAGGLAGYGGGGPRIQLGIGVRRGAWGLEVLGGAIVPDLFFIDCYGDECARTGRRGGYGYFGADLRREVAAARTRYRRLLGRLVVHAGPRMIVGTEALTGYDGFGVSAGASFEGDAYVIGYFVDVGVDAIWMQIPVDHVLGIAPYVRFGGKIGWL